MLHKLVVSYMLCIQRYWDILWLRILTELTVEHPKLLQHPDDTITLHTVQQTSLPAMAAAAAVCNAMTAWKVPMDSVPLPKRQQNPHM
jgi:hypothetical protein